MLEFTVYLKQFQCTRVNLLLQLLYIFEQFMDHIKLIIDLIHFTFLGVRQIVRQSMRLIPCVQCNHVTSHCDWWRKKISCVLVFNYLCNMVSSYYTIHHNLTQMWYKYKYFSPSSLSWPSVGSGSHYITWIKSLHLNISSRQNIRQFEMVLTLTFTKNAEKGSRFLQNTDTFSSNYRLTVK